MKLALLALLAAACGGSVAPADASSDAATDAGSDVVADDATNIAAGCMLDGWLTACVGNGFEWRDDQGVTHGCEGRPCVVGAACFALLDGALQTGTCQQLGGGS